MKGPVVVLWCNRCDRQTVCSLDEYATLYGLQEGELEAIEEYSLVTMRRHLCAVCEGDDEDGQTDMALERPHHEPYHVLKGKGAA